MSETLEIVAPAVPATSLAGYTPAQDETYVRFRHWHAHGSTAYQKGQFAGFPLAIARRLAAGGAADIIGPVLPSPEALATREPAPRRMVTK